GNLNVAALRYEIPKADADVLTAGLRSNPILYADAQGVPYGKYTQERPGGGGLPQYDLNVSVPIDVSRKRLARLDVAMKARKVTEAQLQDELRRLIDQLYAAYGEDREALDEAVAELKSRRSQADFQLKQAERASTRTHRTLAQLLFLSGEEARGLKLRGRLREVAPVPEDAWLVRTALENRPDLAAYRLGLQRAQADVRLARWEDGAIVATGPDPWVRFDLPEPVRVAGVRIRYDHRNDDGSPARFKLAWRGAGGYDAPETQYGDWNLPTGDDLVTTVWIDEPVAWIRLQPDNRPCRFRIRELTLLIEP
ncbi:hypothetical protein HK102_012697, partial [Quaeritorhiza haematococci]